MQSARAFDENSRREREGSVTRNGRIDSRRSLRRVVRSRSRLHAESPFSRKSHSSGMRRYIPREYLTLHVNGWTPARTNEKFICPLLIYRVGEKSREPKRFLPRRWNVKAWKRRGKSRKFTRLLPLSLSRARRCTFQFSSRTVDLIERLRCFIQRCPSGIVSRRSAERKRPTRN